MRARFAPSQLLLLALVATAAAVALTGGGIADAPAGRFEVAVAAVGLACGLAVTAGAVRPGRMPLAWAGVVLLAAFAAWCALSVTWSVLPDASWIAANRALAYAVIAAVALAAASTAPNAAALTALGLFAAGLLVALVALAGKLNPGIHIGPLDLDPGARFSRLSRPLDYWNALALLCVMSTPVPIWLAASRNAAARVRIGAAICLALLLLTAALAYSRGAVLAYLAVLAVMVGAGPRRLTRLAVAAGAPAAVAPAMLVAFTRHDLSAGDVPLSARIDGGLVLGGVLLLCLAGLALLVYELIRLEPRLSWGPARARRAWLSLVALAVVALLGATALVASSSRGLGGEISHQIDSFKQPGTSLSNNPERLISANSSSRYVWWQEALGAFSDRPLSGQGAGSFPVVHYLYRHHEAPVRSSHSLPLMFLSETGLVGFALGMGALALLVGAAVQRLRRSRGVERAARLALLASFAAWFVQSLYDWHWEIPGVTVPALIALCVAAAPPPTRRRRRDRAGAGRLALAGAAAALAATAFAVSSYLPVLSEQKRIDALNESSGPSPDLAAAAADADLAHRLDPFAVEPLFTGASIATRSGRPREGLKLLVEASRTQPDRWQVWRRLYPAYLQAGYGAEAAHTVRELLRTDPLGNRGGEGRAAAEAFSLRHPADSSPTAFGTPPP
jgi:hypothetical protein